MTENEIGTLVVDVAVNLHRDTGPGLMEAVYEIIMATELARRGLHVERQVRVPIVYRDLVFPKAFRADLVVEQKVIIEVKSVQVVLPQHLKQVQTYLKLTGLKLGYLLNFGAPLMKDGITRCVNGL
jgi:GxxExxY protein